MNRNSRTVIIAVVLAALVAVLGFMFVSNRPSVPDGGGADTNVGDSQPGNPDGATAN